MDFNLRLSRIKDKILDLYRTYRNSYGAQEPRPEELKSLIEKELKGRQRVKHMHFIPFFEEILLLLSPAPKCSLNPANHLFTILPKAT